MTILGRQSSSIDRRGVLRGMFGLAAPTFLLSGCGDQTFLDLRPGTGEPRAAFLTPLSGRAANVGAVLRSAASLGGDGVGLTSELEILDSGSDEESAIAAANAAVDGGAKLILGPLFATQARAIESVVPNNIPIVTLSNDVSLASQQTFVFGVTPTQSASAVLSHAARSGKRRVAVAAPPGPIAERSYATVTELAGPLKLDVLPFVELGNPSIAMDELRSVSGGSLPDAIYLPAGGAQLGNYAAAFKPSGIQLLGSTQWNGQAIENNPAFRDAWFATPDPVRFEPFARAMEDRTNVRGGIIAGLAFDAVESARLLGRIEEQDRRGLLRESGFDGVLGPYRFTDDGLCDRKLAVLEVGNGETRMVASPGA